jgi:ankyrin repeat protein
MWLWMTMKMEAPNLELHNKAGETPLDLAREQGHVAVLRVLDRRLGGNNDD